jgi:hypothetical protein
MSGKLEQNDPLLVDPDSLPMVKVGEDDGEYHAKPVPKEPPVDSQPILAKGLLCRNSPFGMRDSRQVPYGISSHFSSSSPHSSLVSHCDWNHCCVSSWHGSPSLDKDASSRKCILYTNHSSPGLGWIDPCFVCPPSLHRHSPRGSLCSFLIFALYTYPFSSSCFDQRDEHATEQEKETSADLTRGLINPSLLPPKICVRKN